MCTITLTLLGKRVWVNATEGWIETFLQIKPGKCFSVFQNKTFLKEDWLKNLAFCVVEKKFKSD